MNRKVKSAWDAKLYTFFCQYLMKTNIRYGGQRPPSQFILPEVKWSRKCVVAKSNNTCASNARGEERGLLILTSPPAPKFRKFIQIKLSAGNLRGYLIFFSFQNSPKYCCMMYEKRAKKRKKRRTRKIEMSKYLHLLSYNYSKNIVKKFEI